MSIKFWTACLQEIASLTKRIEKSENGEMSANEDNPEPIQTASLPLEEASNTDESEEVAVLWLSDFKAGDVVIETPDPYDVVHVRRRKPSAQATPLARDFAGWCPKCQSNRLILASGLTTCWCANPSAQEEARDVDVSGHEGKTFEAYVVEQTPNYLEGGQWLKVDTGFRGVLPYAQKLLVTVLPRKPSAQVEASPQEPIASGENLQTDKDAGSSPSMVFTGKISGSRSIYLNEQYVVTRYEIESKTPGLYIGDAVKITILDPKEGSDEKA